MLFAESRRKLGRDGSRAHDRAEDLLTSTAFQLIRYLPLQTGLLAVLNRVRGVLPGGHAPAAPPAWLRLADVTGAEYEFWPRWAQFGEPDVVVTLFAGTRPVGRLVVEVKLDTGKSRTAGDVAATEAPDPDQLRKYWQGLGADPDVPRLGVVYLTSHAIPPSGELDESLKREPGNWLGWLSWLDVWSVMRAAGDALPARDLADLLAAKGLKAFEGFGMCIAPQLTNPPTFWVRPQRGAVRWFALDPFAPSTSPTFWEGKP